jgi:hypothetical protein
MLRWLYDIDVHNFSIPFSFSIPRHSFEDSKQICRDNNHRIIWFLEGRQKYFGFWTHFVENTRHEKNYPLNTLKRVEGRAEIPKVERMKQKIIFRLFTSSTISEMCSIQKWCLTAFSMQQESLHCCRWQQYSTF